MEKSTKKFAEFIAPSCNRLKFIQDYLFEHDLEGPVISVNGKNHIYVKFPISQYNPMFKIKTVIAHYDRVEGSPGANDNSAAVFCLLEWAAELLKQPGFHNVRLLFTDGEELGDKGVASQGSYDLGKKFKQLGILNDDIFVFDSIGRGTIPVICNANVPKDAPKSFIKRYDSLIQRTQRILRSSVGNKWFSLPADYSDNAGFLAHGIPAVAITMLPSEEVDLYYSALMEMGEENFLSLKKSGDESVLNAIPKTWKMFHTQEDNIENLDNRSFEIFGQILKNLVEIKTIAEK